MTDLDEFLDPRGLLFRAACNDAADAAKRPVRRRVVARLASAPDTALVFHDIWASMALPHGIQSGAVAPFLAAVGGDPRWKTLVAEAIATERAWGDPFFGPFGQKNWDKFVEWLLALLTKAFDRASHPVSNLVGSAGVVFVVWMLAERTGVLKLPLVVEPPDKPVTINYRLNIEPTGTTIPITLVPTMAGGPLPIDIRPSPAALPLKVEFDAPGKLGSVVTAGLGETNVALKQLTGSLELLAKRAPPSDGAAVAADVHAIAQGLADAVAALRAANDHLGTLGGESREQTAISKEEASNLNQALQVVARASTRQQDPIVSKLRRGDRRVVVLRSFEPLTGTYRSHNVTIDAGSIRSNGDARTVELTFRGDGLHISDEFPEGKPIELTGLQWKAVVTSIEKRPFSARTVTLTIAPDAEAIPRKALASASGTRADSAAASE